MRLPLALLAILAASAANAGQAASGNPFEGIYLGGHIGMADAKADLSATSTAYAVTTEDKDQQDMSGNLAGLRLGYNHVEPNNLLMGLELNISSTDVSGDSTHYTQFDTGYLAGGHADAMYQNDITSVSLLQGKLGWANAKYAAYALGGLAMGKGKDSTSYDVYNSGDTLVLADAWGFNQDYTGWTVGLGGEMMVSERLSVSISYNYVKFDTESSSYERDTPPPPSPPGAPPPPQTVELNRDVSVNIGQIGINYHF